MAWGGSEEQKREQEAGNPHAKNWCDEALKIVEKTMEEYWSSNTVDNAHPTMNASDAIVIGDGNTLESDFDRHRRLLLTAQSAGNSGAEAWATELRHYLGDLPADVTKETNILDWWAVSNHFH